LRDEQALRHGADGNLTGIRDIIIGGLGRRWTGPTLNLIWA